MKITNRQAGTNIHEVSDGIFRINTPVNIAGGFSFNQYLIMDDEPLLFLSSSTRELSDKNERNFQNKCT